MLLSVTDFVLTKSMLAVKLAILNAIRIMEKKSPQKL